MHLHPELIKKYFNNEIGFGQYKPDAIELLNLTTKILQEFNINNMLISGTLLGYVRHNDFIPWDDDIDLLVDSSFITKITDINEKYKENITLLKLNNYHFKICFKNKILKLDKIDKVPSSNYLLNDDDSYNWPFIDLFTYFELVDKDKIAFFSKEWSNEHFFPLINVDFLGINTFIPKNPSHFLQRNYGHDYMTVLKANNFSHKKEKPTRVNLKTTMEDYKKTLN